MIPGFPARWAAQFFYSHSMASFFQIPYCISDRGILDPGHHIPCLCHTRIAQAIPNIHNLGNTLDVPATGDIRDIQYGLEVLDVRDIQGVWDVPNAWNILEAPGRVRSGSK